MSDPMNTILVVDDEALIREVIGDFLDNHGFAYKTAKSGTEALMMLYDDPSIGVVLTDLAMPDMGGLEFVAETRSLPDRDLQVAILTGNGQRDDVIQAMRYGVKDFLDKPLDFSRLLDLVRRMEERALLFQIARQKNDKSEGQGDPAGDDFADKDE